MMFINPENMIMSAFHTHDLRHNEIINTEWTEKNELKPFCLAV